MANPTEVRQTLEQFCDLRSQLPDEDVPEGVSATMLRDLLGALMPVLGAVEGQGPYEWLTTNRNRGAVLAALRFNISRNYSPVVQLDTGQRAHISPTHALPRDGGVMFTQGGKRWQGLICKFKDGEVRFAVTARDVADGEWMTEDDFNFVSLEEVRESVGAKADRTAPQEAVNELEQLVNAVGASEHQFQELLERAPWMFGASHRVVASHQALNDENIPDFTAVRTAGGSRDIVEIKRPDSPVLTAGGHLTAEFLRAWTQAAHYVAFATRNAGHLLDAKGWRFENPQCYLLYGNRHDAAEWRAIRNHQQANPARVHVLSYSDLLAQAKHVLAFAERLQAGEGASGEEVPVDG